MLKHKPTGITYENRLEAKQKLGHSTFNKEMKSGQIEFINNNNKE